MKNTVTICSWVPRGKAYTLTLSKWESGNYSLLWEDLPSLYSNPKTHNSWIEFFSSLEEARNYCLSAGLL